MAPKIRLRGFTLLEVLFAALITGAMVGVCYNIFIAQHKTAYTLDKKNEALKSALVAKECIEKDLKQLVTVPLQINDDGTSKRQYGDHTAPVKIGYGGRSIAFYMPKTKAMSDGSATDPANSKEEPAIAVAYVLVPAKVQGETRSLYNIKRIVGEIEIDDENVEDTAISADGRILGSVTVETVQFRLLDPKTKRDDPTEGPSPDTNYYIETVITGADKTGAEALTLGLISNLDFPSLLQKHPNLQPTVRYEPETPLITPPGGFVPNKKDEDTIKDLEQAVEDLNNGKLTSEELEDIVEDLINKHAGDPAHGPVWDTTGRFVPRVTDLKHQNPNPAPGQPIHLADPNGVNVLLPVPDPPPHVVPTPVVPEPDPNNVFVTQSMATFTEDPPGSGKWKMTSQADFSAGGDDLSSGQIDQIHQTAQNWQVQNGVDNMIKMPWE